MRQYLHILYTDYFLPVLFLPLNTFKLFHLGLNLPRMVVLLFTYIKKEIYTQFKNGNEKDKKKMGANNSLCAVFDTSQFPKIAIY